MQNTESAQSSYQCSWIEVQGKDTVDFFHRLSTVDCKSLNVGGGQWGFFLNSLGKIQSFFNLWMLGKEHLGFEIYDDSKGSGVTAFRNWIDKFHFGEDLHLVETPRQLVRMGFQNLESAPASFESLGTSFKTRMPFKDLGLEWIAEWSLSRSEGVRPEMFSENDRIEKMFPWPGMEMIFDSVLPTEVHLQSAVQEKRGCYPGQEVLERIFTRGASPRSLCLIELDGEIPIPSPLYIEKSGPVVGQLLSTNPGAGVPRTKTLGLAMIGRTHLNQKILTTQDGSTIKILKVNPHDKTL